MLVLAGTRSSSNERELFAGLGEVVCCALLVLEAQAIWLFAIDAVQPCLGEGENRGTNDPTFRPN